jgi:hypothetical protein
MNALDKQKQKTNNNNNKNKTKSKKRHPSQGVSYWIQVKN